MSPPVYVHPRHVNRKSRLDSELILTTHEKDACKRVKLLA